MYEYKSKPAVVIYIMIYNDVGIYNAFGNTELPLHQQTVCFFFNIIFEF